MWQKCVICNGEGTIPSKGGVSTMEICPICKGSRIINEFISTENVKSVTEDAITIWQKEARERGVMFIPERKEDSIVDTFLKMIGIYIMKQDENNDDYEKVKEYQTIINKLKEELKTHINGK